MDNIVPIKAVVSKIEDVETFDGLENDWTALSQESNALFLSYDWMRTCYTIFHKDDSLLIFTLRIDDQISAIVPLVIRKKRKGFVKILEYIGSRFHYEPCGILSNSLGIKYLDRVLTEIYKIKLPLYLKRGQHNDIVRCMAEHGIAYDIFTAVSAPFVPVTGTFETFASNLSKQRRYDLKRARRRAEQRGTVKFEILKPNQGEVIELLQICYRIEASGWKSQKGSAILNHYLPLRDFFNSYATKAAEKGIFRIGLMYIADAPVAMLFGVEYAKCFWVLKTGYDEEFSECSPGIQLMHECVRYSFANDLDRFEFLGSDEAWVHIWAKYCVHTYSDVNIYPNCYRGFFARFLKAK